MQEREFHPDLRSPYSTPRKKFSSESLWGAASCAFFSRLARRWVLRGRVSLQFAPRSPIPQRESDVNSKKYQERVLEPLLLDLQIYFNSQAWIVCGFRIYITPKDRQSLYTLNAFCSNELPAASFVLAPFRRQVSAVLLFLFIVHWKHAKSLWLKCR